VLDTLKTQTVGIDRGSGLFGISLVVICLLFVCYLFCTYLWLFGAKHMQILDFFALRNPENRICLIIDGIFDRQTTLRYASKISVSRHCHIARPVCGGAVS
jgi:hypothetical protein